MIFSVRCVFGDVFEHLLSPAANVLLSARTTVRNMLSEPTNLEVLFEFFPMSGDVWGCLETKS